LPLRDDLLNPIPGENPSGQNLRYDPVYDKIKEARREDDDAPQGEWQRERKAADFKAVIALAGDALATRSKDLQLAAWLTEALLRQQGFSGLRQGLDLFCGLIENFWDTLYPEVDEGDLDFRAAPLGWVGVKLDGPLRKAPITRGGYGFYTYQESRSVGYEDQADTDARREERASKIADGKLAPEDFDKDSAGTPIERYEAWVAALDGCLESLKKLDGLCDERFGNAAPGFSTLRTALEEVRHITNQLLRLRLKQEGLEQEGRSPAAEEEDAIEEEFVEEAGGAQAPARAPRPRKAGPAGSLEPQDADDAAARIAAVAKYLRAQDSSSPAPYLLLRGYRWGELRGFGDSPDPAVLEPPTSEVRQSIRKLALEANWTELLEAAENAMVQPCGRAWLDLQRYVVRAAEEYGYSAIAQAVRSELRALLIDLPQLPTWTLMDDTPTANAETQAFLKELATPAAEAEAPAVRNLDDDEHEAPEPGEAAPPDTYALALEAARTGHAGDAIQMLSDEIARQQSGRARFQRKLQLAQICMLTGHEALAQPILEELAGTINSHRLEEWEAASAVAHPLTLLYRCLKKLDGDAGTKQKLYAQISRLDPMQALECER
jgi:type VI secretion system protein ImpA